VKVKLVYERPEEPEIIISMRAVPRVGDKIMLTEAGPAEIIDVVHTPMDVDYEAVLLLRRGKL
jgi:hypothetical protein